MIANFDRDEAGSSAEKADGKIDKLEFVVGMITQLGLVEWDDIVPFIKQFDKLDEDGSGSLDKDDLIRASVESALDRSKTIGLDLNDVSDIIKDSDKHRRPAKKASRADGAGGVNPTSVSVKVVSAA